MYKTKKLTSANVETVKGASEEKKGGVPNRVRASESSCSNPSEKKAANFISGYSNAQRAAINQLEPLNLAESKAEVYKSHLREYPT